MMKLQRKFAGLFVFWTIFCSVTILKAATPWLHTDANLIKDPAGNVVVLRGVDTIDIGAVQSWYSGGMTALIDRLTDKNDPCGSYTGWYTKVIRLAVYPADEEDFFSPFTFHPGSDTYYNTLLRPVVDYCKTKDIYAIIDWHYVGNDTWTKVTQTSQFWEYMAPRFANDSHVLFELFNEPLNTSPGNEAQDWNSVRTDMQTWVNIIRSYAPNNLILVAGPSWSQAIGPAATYPLAADNIVIVSHIYPGHWLNNQSWYTTHINTCLTRYPVFMSEWGFCQTAGYSLLQGTITNYGQPVTDFREARKISSSAWVSDYSWEPPMFYSNWGLRIGEGEMGGFTKDMLYLKKDANQPVDGDTETPAAPTGLSAIGDNEMVTLDWDDNSEGDLYGYDIYRSTIPGSGYSRINRMRTKDSNYIDSNVTPDVTYYYVVTAVDTSFNYSDTSEEISVAATDTTAPAIPSSLMATSGNGMVLLNWNDNGEEDLAGYTIYRSTTSGSDYVKINDSFLNDSIYIDSDVTNETTYYYVLTATDIYENESEYSTEVSVTPSVNGPVVYNYMGRLQADVNYNAYMCDVDQFPFGSDGTNRNTFAEATNSQYIGIWENDSGEWASVNPGSGDEDMLWLEMKINEPAGDITRIDLTFNGCTGGSGAVPHKIYVLKAGTDWTLDSSWVQVGSDQNITPGTFAVMTRSITSNISDYIDGTGKIVWGAYETTSAQMLHVNYVQAAVFGSGFANYPPTVSVTAPANGTIFAKDSNVAIGVSSWDTDGIVTKVEFYAGSTKLGEDILTPYSYTWNSVPSGLYSLTARATDDDGNTIFSSSVNITVLGETGTGGALCEWWTGISGSSVSDLTSDINYPNNPAGRELLLNMEGPTNWQDNYGTRIRGFLYPVADGDYTFWIAADDSGQLWLSTDDNAVNASMVAYVPGAAQSSPISLAGGQKYYIEVLHKEGTGNDNISVSWQGPGIGQQVIGGVFLSPCCLKLRDFTGFANQWKRSDCGAGNDWCEGFDFNRDGSVVITDLKSFAESWLEGI